MVEEFERPESPDSPPAAAPQHPTVRFERSDVNFVWILGILLGALLLGGIILTGVFRFYHIYGEQQARIKRSDYPVLPVRHGSLPAEPSLEQIKRMAGNQEGNVYLRQAQEESILNSYGEVEEGYLHIPIGRAMDALADKLPAREPPSPEQVRRQNGLVDSGASNSGRMFR
ncbi:MAG TPA: hypothetical protein VKS79_02625, partial [Gemmataceae bacterium]|nr:hypothetical protein [Gemmataceae bacterium]